MAGNMLNQYMDLKRIEFVVTNACTSRCKHCSLIKSISVCKIPRLDELSVLG